MSKGIHLLVLKWFRLNSRKSLIWKHYLLLKSRISQKKIFLSTNEERLMQWHDLKQLDAPKRSNEWMVMHDFSGLPRLRIYIATSPIVQAVDHWVDFGGDFWHKIIELRKLLRRLDYFIMRKKKHHWKNGQIETMRRIDDEENCKLRNHKIRTNDDFYKVAMSYLYYFNSGLNHISLGSMPSY